VMGAGPDDSRFDSRPRRRALRTRRACPPIPLLDGSARFSGSKRGGWSRSRAIRRCARIRARSDPCSHDRLTVASGGRRTLDTKSVRSVWALSSRVQISPTPAPRNRPRDEGDPDRLRPASGNAFRRYPARTCAIASPVTNSRSRRREPSRTAPRASRYAARCNRRLRSTVTRSGQGFVSLPQVSEQAGQSTSPFDDARSSVAFDAVSSVRLNHAFFSRRHGRHSAVRPC